MTPINKSNKMFIVSNAFYTCEYFIAETLQQCGGNYFVLHLPALSICEQSKA